jgi:hypothetical protein
VKIIKEGAVSFAAGVVPKHSFCGLPTFYDKNIKALKGSIPLKIFDLLWQKRAAAHSAEKRSIDRNSSKEKQYTGHPAPDKWSKTYAAWSRNYQFFQAMMKEVYNYHTLAEWLAIHKAWVDEIMRQDGFCTGFCYNLAVRTNTFQCNTYRDGKLVFPDISLPQPNIEQQAYSKAQARDKLHSLDNPYVVGGAREEYNPHTSQLKNNTNKKRGFNNQANNQNTRNNQNSRRKNQ